MPAYKKRKTMSMEAKLKKLEKKVREIDNLIETKEKSYAVQEALPGSDIDGLKAYAQQGNVQVMTTFSRGDGGTGGEFIGDQITHDRMWLRYCNAFQGFNCNYRVALVWDKEDARIKSDGSSTSRLLFFSDIFQDDTAKTGDEPLAGINLKNRDRFKILYDSINSKHRYSQMQLSVSQTDGGTFQELIRDTGEAYIDLKGKVSTFETGLPGVETTPTTGNLLLVTIANTGLAPTTPGGAPTITGCDRFVQMQARLRYKDA